MAAFLVMRFIFIRTVSLRKKSEIIKSYFLNADFKLRNVQHHNKRKARAANMSNECVEALVLTVEDRHPMIPSQNFPYSYTMIFLPIFVFVLVQAHSSLMEKAYIYSL